MSTASLRALSVALITVIAAFLWMSCVHQHPLPGALAAPPADEPFVASTTVKIDDSLWFIRGKMTHPKCRAEGMLLNVRMVNATFEDRNPKTCPKGFDADKNTAAFIARIPEYAKHGINAFTLCLQGGSPGYEGALNSAYNADGSLRPDYMKRVARVIEACDRAGLVIILGCFYQRQDQVLKDTAAVKNAVVNTVKWIDSRKYTNILLEIANEFPHSGFDHAIIKDPLQIRELITLAQKARPGLLVSASGMGNGRVPHSVTTVADFVLLHFNSTKVDAIFQRVASASKVTKALVCNEDDKTGEEAANALDTSIDAFCSWGYMNSKKNQYYPFEFEGAADDPIVYAKFKELSTPR